MRQDRIPVNLQVNLNLDLAAAFPCSSTRQQQQQRQTVSSSPDEVWGSRGAHCPSRQSRSRAFSVRPEGYSTPHMVRLPANHHFCQLPVTLTFKSSVPHQKSPLQQAYPDELTLAWPIRCQQQPSIRGRSRLIARLYVPTQQYEFHIIATMSTRDYLIALIK